MSEESDAEVDVRQFYEEVKNLINVVDESFEERYFNDRDTRILSFYFSLLEEVEEALFLILNERYVALPLLARSVGELTLDVINIINIDDYHDRLLYSSLNREINIVEFRYKYLKGSEEIDFPEGFWDTQSENSRYAKKEKQKLEEKGINKGVGGIRNKFRISKISNHKTFYNILDRLNQEIHTDMRLALERFDAGEYKFKSGVKLSVERNVNFVDPYLSLLGLSMCLSTEEIISQFDPKYSNTIEVYLDKFEGIFRDVYSA